MELLSRDKKVYGFILSCVEMFFEQDAAPDDASSAYNVCERVSSLFVSVNEVLMGSSIQFGNIFSGVYVIVYISMGFKPPNTSQGHSDLTSFDCSDS